MGVRFTDKVRVGDYAAAVTAPNFIFTSGLRLGTGDWLIGPDSLDLTSQG